MEKLPAGAGAEPWEQHECVDESGVSDPSRAVSRPSPSSASAVPNENGFSASLILEITESVLMPDVDVARQRIRDLKPSAFRLR